MGRQNDLQCSLTGFCFSEGDSHFCTEPGARNSGAQRLFRNASDGSEFSKQEHLTSKLNALIGRPICSLLSACCPSAISRLVVAVIIDAINRVAGRRAFAHVGKKGTEIFPPLAHGDTALSIVPSSYGILLRTSSDHTSPRCVSKASGSGMKVCSASMLAATGIVFIRAKCSRAQNALIAAIASTSPSVVILSALAGYNGQESESLAEKVELYWLHGERPYHG